MRRRTAISLVAVLGLSACAHAIDNVEAPPPVAMAWGLNHVEGEGAKLAYGAPGSDNLILMMTCQPRSDEVAVTLVGFEADAHPKVTLGSGRISTRIQAERTPGMGGYDVSANTRATNTALRRFAETGELIVGVGARKVALPPAELSVSGGFVRSCGA